MKAWHPSRKLVDLFVLALRDSVDDDREWVEALLVRAHQLGVDFEVRA